MNRQEQSPFKNMTLLLGVLLFFAVSTKTAWSEPVRTCFRDICLGEPLKPDSIYWRDWDKGDEFKGLFYGPRPDGSCYQSVSVGYQLKRDLSTEKEPSSVGG